MKLTKRRLQFLDKLVELYQRTRLPIHYETLALSLGVSKWTAYDMMKEMEKQGFVSRSYEVNSKETGRSQVVFAPTDQATDLFSASRADHYDPTDWEHTVTQIRKLLNSVKDSNVNEVIRKVMNEISSKASNMEFCGYILGLLLVYIKKLGAKTESLISLLVTKKLHTQGGILLFVGTVMGTVIQTMNEELGNELAELVSKFLDTLDRLTHQEQRLLSDMLQEALA
ncbi:Lrp/AsnC family transcriptional regulator [Paenibacillus aceti]|uniref:DNA-binding protein n=1 Tax=Paenibacillus aceti TaxID=1820010 RepID=A0ABQ1W1S5_9BACL|nr:Lrp/AsnC family transcriptional regulator [Paenibacillus aceti]GGG07576.1 hypothetical protein GCM10010913_31780 [Paenibacillus aceti]